MTPGRITPRAIARGVVVLSVLTTACSTSHADGSDPTALVARRGWVADVDTLRARVDVLGQILADSTLDQARAQAAFRAARASFKRIEGIATYYEPSTVRAMNGPALPRPEPGDGPEVVFPPEGFQVIEELLFADDPPRRSEARDQVLNLGELANRLHRSMAAQIVTDDRVWDAARLEIARVGTLGISGFDSPIAGDGLTESAAALEGVARMLSPFAQRIGRSRWRALNDRFSAATATLRDTSHFDHLAFIVANLNPLARALDSVRVALGLGLPPERRAFRADAAGIYDSASIDPGAFAPPGALADSPALIAEGVRLFNDPALSGDGKRSCATCHDQARAFTDGRARSIALTTGIQLRNAPTVINAGLQTAFFADMRTTFLEDQIAAVIGNPHEMAGKPTTSEVRRAIAAYIRSLTRLNSPVDRALRGDTNAIGADARRGFGVFMGKGRCGTCHFAPLFNGTVPPYYQDTESEVLGVPASVSSNRIDPDVGRFGVTRSTPHRFAFKTPTLRNVAETAPYMHNGVFRTLEEVIDFYDVGGGAGRGISLPNQTLPADSLHLTRGEKGDLIAFLRALTDSR